MQRAPTSKRSQVKTQEYRRTGKPEEDRQTLLKDKGQLGLWTHTDTMKTTHGGGNAWDTATAMAENTSWASKTREVKLYTRHKRQWSIKIKQEVTD